jgi:hypothetical protein
MLYGKNSVLMYFSFLLSRFSFIQLLRRRNKLEAQVLYSPRVVAVFPPLLSLHNVFHLPGKEKP